MQLLLGEGVRPSKMGESQLHEGMQADTSINIVSIAVYVQRFCGKLKLHSSRTKTIQIWKCILFIVLSSEQFYLQFASGIA